MRLPLEVSFCISRRSSIFFFPQCGCVYARTHRKDERCVVMSQVNFFLFDWSSLMFLGGGGCNPKKSVEG